MVLAGCERVEELPPASPEVLRAGESVYGENCAQCHFAGEGNELNPPLRGSGIVAARDPSNLLRVILKGQSGPIVVGGKQFNGIMPDHAFLTDEEVAAVATWVREKFGRHPGVVPAEAVARVRAEP